MTVYCAEAFTEDADDFVETTLEGLARAGLLVSNYVVEHDDDRHLVRVSVEVAAGVRRWPRSRYSSRSSSSTL